MNITETNYFPTEGQLFYFWKGRVALYLMLKALGIGAGDEVIVPGFTCVVVPNAVLYTGATPTYVDIDPETYNVNVQTIEKQITSKTRAIIVQSTFGLSPDLDPIMALAEVHGIPVIDDCTHGLGGSYKDQPNGTVTDAAFFSSQWSKPISTGIGGIAFIRNPELAQRVSELAKQIPIPSKSTEIMLAGQRLLRPLADIPALHYPLIKTYRWLTQQLGLSVGSSSNTELTSIEMPADYLKSMGKWQRNAWNQGLQKLPQTISKRQNVAKYYNDFFQKETGPTIPVVPSYAEHGMLRYTIRVPDNSNVLDQARNSSIPLGDWFTSPLYPINGDLTPWKYRRGQCPVAEQACREIVNLPTNHALTESQLQKLFSLQKFSVSKQLIQTTINQ